MDVRKPEAPFNEYLYGLRQAQGWGVREAARAIGIAHSRLLDFEQGFDQHTRRPCVPALATLFRIAKAFERPTAEVLARAGYALPDAAADERERALLMRFRRLSGLGRERLMRFIDDLEGGGASRAAES